MNVKYKDSNGDDILFKYVVLIEPIGTNKVKVEMIDNTGVVLELSKIIEITND